MCVCVICIDVRGPSLSVSLLLSQYTIPLAILDAAALENYSDARRRRRRHAFLERARTFPLSLTGEYMRARAARRPRFRALSCLLPSALSGLSPRRFLSSLPARRRSSAPFSPSSPPLLAHSREKSYAGDDNDTAPTSSQHLILAVTVSPQ